MAFLTNSQSSDYTPGGGEIAGILKGLGDDMKKDLSEATEQEESSKSIFGDLMAAKSKEVKVCTEAIETKTVRVGELGVSIVNMKGDSTDTEAALIEDKKFLGDLDVNCANRAAEWDVVKQTRADELVALAEVIKLLQDDDALELFKKALPSASSSLMQVATATAAIRAKALAIVSALHKPGSVTFDFLTLALQGKKVSFEKVIKMIDNMTTLLKQEQVDDDNKKEFCRISLDNMDDKKKGLERSISDSESVIATAQEDIGSLTSEIKALEDGIKALDKSVMEAAEQRKEENEDFTSLTSQNAAAKELIGIAKNRLNKFYNPKLYAPPPKRELSEADRIAVNMGGTAPPTPAPGGIGGTGVTVLAQVSVHAAGRDAPPPPPEAVGAYQAKSDEAGGVIGMMDLLVRDLDKETTVATTEEQHAQAEYEQMTKDAAAKRSDDSKSIQSKVANKADTEAALEAHTEKKAANSKELMAVMEYTSSLHGECDWLIQYYDMRKEARAGEIESLAQAKAVLSGADFTLVQAKSKGLRRA